MKLKKKASEPDIGLNLNDRDVYERYYVKVVGDADGFYFCSILFRPTHTMLVSEVSEKEAIKAVKKFEGMSDAELIDFMIANGLNYGIRAYQQSNDINKEFASEEEWYAKAWSVGTSKLWDKAKVKRSLVSMPAFKEAYREAARTEVSIGRTTCEDETEAPVGDDDFVFETEDEVEVEEEVKPARKVLKKKAVKQEDKGRLEDLEKEARKVLKLLKKKK